MWSSLDCITWQIYLQGDYSWQAALDRAQQVKSRRENETWEESREPAEGVVPARSAAHRAHVEDLERHDEEPEPERVEAEKEKMKKKKRKGREEKRLLRRQTWIAGDDVADRLLMMSEVPGEQSYEDLQSHEGYRVNVAFSMSPQGLEEVFDVMGKMIPEQPFDEWTSTWGKVRSCLDSAADWACAYGRAKHHRVLKRLSALLLFGEWGASPLDVPPHPKIPGACLIPASYTESPRAWSDNLQWNQEYLLEDLLQASKWLTILAWHFSLRPNRNREFEWCRLAAVLLREARGSLRAAAREPAEKYR
eukprot:s2325_g19.t1